MLSRQFWYMVLQLTAFVLAGSLSAEAQTALKTIDNPGGGRITYGPVKDATSLPTAMGKVLKNLHVHFGDRPRVGRFFRTRDGHLVATFFTLNASNDGGKAITGLAIVSMSGEAKPTAAVIYDDAQRFARTASPMMRRLEKVWRPANDGAAASARGRSGSVSAVRPLHTTQFPDGSGSVGLPAGWRITSAHQGTVFAEGPNGQAIRYGVTLPVSDPRNPQQRQMLDMETQGGRIPLPGLNVVYPYGADPALTLLAVTAQLAQKQHLPTPTLRISSRKDLGIKYGGHYFLFKGVVDEHNEKGLLQSTIQMSFWPPQNGVWIMILSQVVVPVNLADREQPTLVAIGNSYKENADVIQSEGRDEVSRIKQIGADAKARTDASNRAFDEHNAAWERSQDSNSRSSQAFSNYILDNSVVEDIGRNYHGTLSNEFADSLVKSNPQRYQYVPTKDFIKGIDY